MIALRVLALLLFIFVPGWLAASLIGRGDAVDGKERIFLAALLGMGIVGLSALALALASSYSLASLLILVGALAALLALAARKRVAWLWQLRARDFLFSIIVIIVALILFVPPGHTVFGWTDVGQYVDIAAQIERNGGQVITDATVTEVAPEHRNLLYQPNENPSLPFQAYENKTFFITDFETGRVVPQFYYLWPSAMAVFASFLGLASMFWAVTAMAILALWGLLLLARRLLGWRWGLIAAILAALSPLLLYFARYTTSEMMNMALFIGAALCLTAYLETSARGERKASVHLAVAAAFLFTLGFLCRIDFLLVLIPLAIFYLGKRIFSDLDVADRWFLGLLLAGASIAVAVGSIFSGPYFASVRNMFTPFLNRIYRFPGVLVTAAFVLAFIFAPRLSGVAAVVKRSRKLWVALLWLAVGATFIGLYYFHPHASGGAMDYGVINAIQGPSYADQTLARWAWYLSFAGVVLVFAGYGLWFSRRRKGHEVPIVLMGGALTLVYALNMRCTPLQILTMRRLIPVILPVAVIMIVYALKSVVDGAVRFARGKPGVIWMGRLAALALFLYLAIFFVNAAVPIFGLGEGGNQLTLNGDIASAVNDAVVIMDYHMGDLYGPPLRCIYGVKNAWLMDNSYLDSADFPALLADLGFPEKPVYLLWRPSMSGEHISVAQGLQIYPAGVFHWQEQALESSFTQRPKERVFYDEEVELFRLEEQPAVSAL